MVAGQVDGLLASRVPPLCGQASRPKNRVRRKYSIRIRWVRDSLGGRRFVIPNRTEATCCRFQALEAENAGNKLPRSLGKRNPPFLSRTPDRVRPGLTLPFTPLALKVMYGR